MILKTATFQMRHLAILTKQLSILLLALLCSHIILASELPNANLIEKKGKNDAFMTALYQRSQFTGSILVATH